MTRSPGCSPADAALLEPLLRLERVQRMDEILARRTRNLCLVAADLLDPHNRAGGGFKPSQQVAGGAARCLRLHASQSALECVASLKARSMQTAVTSLTDAVPVDSLDCTRPAGMGVSDEKCGGSEGLLDALDLRFPIPTLGFIESLHISGAAALLLQHAVNRRAEAFGEEASDLSEENRIALRARWVHDTVRERPAARTEIKRRRAEETP